jgi:hypothetical protein
VTRREVIARLTRALELLHDGDPAAAIRVIEDLKYELGQPDFGRPHRCPSCGNTFRWPGELTEHVRNVHGWGTAA